MGISNVGAGSVTGLKNSGEATKVTAAQVKAALKDAIKDGALDKEEFQPLLSQGKAGLARALQEPEVLERLGVIGDAVLGGKNTPAKPKPGTHTGVKGASTDTSSSHTGVKGASTDTSSSHTSVKGGGSSSTGSHTGLKD